MGMLKPCFWGLLVYTTAVHAAPPNPTAVACCEIKKELGINAAAVCSSYLGPRETTVIVTTVAVQTHMQTETLPPATQSTTVELTTTVFITSEQTQYVQNPTQTQYQTVSGPTETVYKYQPLRKRENAVCPASSVHPVLCNLERRFSKPVVSAGCSCVFRPTTATVTLTVTAIDRVLQTCDLDPLETFFVTNTQYVPVTHEVDQTVTLGPTSTNTVQVTTTITPDPVIGSAICGTTGSSGSTQNNYLTTMDISLTSCISTCKADDRCLSTRFYYLKPDPNSKSLIGVCRFYNKPVADVIQRGAGSDLFNDKDCPAASAPIQTPA